MEMEILLPCEVPVMTLPNVAFFPQTLLPLHIFEARYRLMLKEVLATDRLFAVAGLNSSTATTSRRADPPHRVASVGIVRACQKNDNGTSDLLLQGLARVEIVGIVSDVPYRRIRIRALESAAGAPADENQRQRDQLARLLTLKSRLGRGEPGEIARFLKTVHDPETFVDLAAFSLCENPVVKQKLLETLDVSRRIQLFSKQVQAEIESIKLRRRLQGRLPDDQIESN